MRKKLTLSIDEDVYRELQLLPRGFSVSEFTNFMLRGMLKEIQGKFPTQDDFEEWVNGEAEFKKVREGIREAWGPSLNPIINKIDSVISIRKKSSKSGDKK